MIFFQKEDMACEEAIGIISAGEKGIEWFYWGKHSYVAFEDALVKALHIKSRRQKKILHSITISFRV